MVEHRICTNCESGYWPGRASHAEWCAPCAGLNDAGRMRRLKFVARKRAELAEKEAKRLLLAGNEGQK